MSTPFHSQILHLFQFADEKSNSHIYKFSQNILCSYNVIAGCTKLRNEIETQKNKNQTKPNQTKRSEILRNATKYTKLRNETQPSETKFTIMRNEMKRIQRNETKYTKVRNAMERNGI